MVNAVKLDGAHNVRDIGGLRTLHGARTRAHLLYRGDSLDAISEEDEDRLFRQLGIGVVIDLRTEAEARPAAWRESGIQHWRIPLITEAFLGKQPVATVSASQLAAAYLSDLRRGAVALQQIYTILANELSRALPCIVHCAAGRDRTGAVIAVLLAAVGVRDEDVASDYTQSNRHAYQLNKLMAANPMYANGLTADGPPALASPETVTVLLRLIRESSESPTRFLHECGLAPSILDKIECAILG